MPGANYMGGRRNAVKAKSKDKIIRAQKDFFGRRRLNILSRGLAVAFEDSQPSNPLNLSSRVAERVSIDLGHAKKSLSASNTKEEAISNATPKSVANSKKRKRDQGTGTSLAGTSFPSSSSSNGRHMEGGSSTKRVKSKLLQELDLLEPISATAAISQILSMPDFAGLSSPAEKTLSSKSAATRPTSLLQDDSEKRESMQTGVDIPEDEFSDYAVNESRSYSQTQTSPLLSYISSSLAYSRGHESELSSIHTPERGSHSGARSHSCISSKHSLPSDSYSTAALSHSNTGTKVLKWNIPPRRPVSPIATSESSSSISSYSQCDLSPSSPQGQTKQLSQVNKHGSKEILSDWYSLDYEPNADDLRDHKNLLDFSDPWTQIGVLLGLPGKDLQKCDSETFKSLNYEKTTHTQREESELPPSDIAFDLEASSDDMSFAGTAGSLFLEADFSDKGFSLESWNTSEYRDISLISDPQSYASLGLGFDDALYMDNIFDSIAPRSQSSQVCPCETEPGQAEEKEKAFGEILDRNSPKGIACDDFLEHSVQPSDTDFMRENNVEQTTLIFMNKLLATSLHNIPLEDGDDRQALQRCGMSRDDAADTKSGNEGVLCLPELEECGGFYRGPSLLSDGSECSEQL